MKIQGKALKGPQVVFVVIPREDGDIIFKAKAVLDLTPFEQLCPEPKPPLMLKGNQQIVNVEAPSYKSAMASYLDKRMNWLILKSLEDSDGLEWEQVKMDDHTTWAFFREELKDAGFTIFEVNRIIAGAIEANGLSDTRMEEARKRFLLSQQAPQSGSSSQKDGQKTTQSGGPVSE